VRDAGGDHHAMVRRVKDVETIIPKTLFSLRSLRRFEGPMGRWSDTTPDSSQMFVRDESGRDLYTLDVEFP